MSSELDGTHIHHPSGGPALDMYPWGVRVYPETSYHPSKTLRRKAGADGEAKSVDRKTGLR